MANDAPSGGEANEALSSFLDALTDSVVALDKAGTIVATNAAWRSFARSNGCIPDRVWEGADYLAACEQATGPDAALAREAAEGLRAVLSGRRAVFELEYPCHSPTEQRWFRMRASRLPASGRARVLVGHENITARKHAEDALRESETLFRRLAEASFEGVVIHDGERVIEVNAAAPRMFGYEREEVVGAPVALFIAPSELETLRANARADAVVAYESIGVRKDGSTFPIYLRARSIEIDGHKRRVGVVRDLTEQKRAAAALRESEQQLREAQEIARLGRWEFDLETGKVGWSDMVFEILGRDRGLGPPSFDELRTMIHPDDLASFDALLTQPGSIEVGDFGYERRVRRSDGSYCWVRNQVRPFRDSAGRVVRLVGAARDVTERREAEERLRASEAEFRAIFEMAGRGKFEMDPDSGRFVRVNKGFCSLTGYDADELAELTYRDLTPAEDRSAEAVVFDRLLRGEGPAYERDRRLVRKDGTIVWARVSLVVLRDPEDRPTCLVGVVEDVTERRRADEALRESEKRFRQFADNSRDVLWIADAATLGMEYISPAFDRIFGQSREPFLRGEKAILDMIHPDDHAAVRGAVDRVLKYGSTTLDERVVKPDGTVRWIHNSGFAMPDDDGVVRRIGGIAEDVTERRASEARLKLLAAEVDHRAKNMLALVQVMLRQTRAPTVAEYAKSVQGRIAALARAHTLLSRSHWRGADLGKLVADELTPFGRREGERIVVGGPAVALRPEAAQSVAMALHELATNAMKYGALSVPNGRVTVEWTRRDKADLVLRWTEADGPAVSPPSRKGIGTAVIQRSIGQQLRGHVEFDWRPTGLACEMRIPANELVSEGA